MKSSEFSYNRKSNLELLRILSMLTIIGVHYIGVSNAFDLISNTSFSYQCLNVIETFFNYGVNLFVLITGYFMIDRESVSISKVLKLLLDVAIYGVSIYIFSVIISLHVFSLTELIKSSIPILFGYRWFIKAYIVLYLLIPFLNMLLNNLSRKEYLTLIAVFAIFFSIWPSFLPNPPLDDYGFSYQHFIFMYMIAGYLKHFVKNVKASYCWLALLFSSMITIGLEYSPSLPIPFIHILHNYRWAHNSPFNIIATISIFLLFRKLDFQNKTINILAASAFPVFLIHGDYNIIDWLFNDLLNVKSFYSNISWIIYFLISIIAIYLVCFAIDFMKQRFLNKAIDKIFQHSKVLNYEIKAIRQKTNTL